jgi:hypothetical protein
MKKYFKKGGNNEVNGIIAKRLCCFTVSLEGDVD